MTPPQMPRDWLKSQMTVPNIVILITALLGVGGYIQSFVVLQNRVLAIETTHKQDMDHVALTYQRKDVQNESWNAVRDQLSEIRRELAALRVERER